VNELASEVRRGSTRPKEGQTVTSCANKKVQLWKTNRAHAQKLDKKSRGIREDVGGDSQRVGKQAAGRLGG